MGNEEIIYFGDKKNLEEQEDDQVDEKKISKEFIVGGLRETVVELPIKEGFLEVGISNQLICVGKIN